MHRRPGLVAFVVCLLVIGVVVVGNPGSQLPPLPAGPAVGPLKASGRYFVTPDGKPVLLTGAHTWQNMQDTGFTDPPPAFDYHAYLNQVHANGQNFFRLWTWEQARYSVEIPSDNYFTAPSPYTLRGPGLVFDVDTFNQPYFDRMRTRVRQAGAMGVYVSIMLFNGWSLQARKGDSALNNPWKGHPFNAANNVNGVNGDLDGDGSGTEVHTLANPQVTKLQERYVRKVIDTVGDLGNVLYEIANEGPEESAPWQYHMISYIKARDPHPVGMTAIYPDGDNKTLWDSPADWISPNGDLDNPPPRTGQKVVLADTDHLCGLCGDREWPWKSFTRGENPVYMDAYDGAYGIGGSLNDRNAAAIRAQLGYVRRFAVRMDLRAAVPAQDVCSTGFCLAGPSEYLVFSPHGAFTLNADTHGLKGEWFSLDSTTTVAADGGPTEFTPPFDGPAVLYLRR